MRKVLSVLVCILLTIPAFATGSATPTSKGYVDAQMDTLQDNLPGAAANTVVTTTATAGETGTKAIYDASGNYAEQQNALVTAEDANTATQMAIQGELVCREYDPTGQYCYVYDVAVHSERINMFPAPLNQTQSKNGVTITVRDGVYYYSGTASQETFFDFELTKGYTFKASVEQGGDSVMYFWNNKVFPMHGPNHYLQFLDASKNLIDVWALTELNRKNASYGTQTGHTAKYLRIYVYSGENMNDFSFAPMFVEDGVTTYTHFYPYIENVYLPAAQ